MPRKKKLEDETIKLLYSLFLPVVVVFTTRNFVSRPISRFVLLSFAIAGRRWLHFQRTIVVFAYNVRPVKRKRGKSSLVSSGGFGKAVRWVIRVGRQVERIVCAVPYKFFPETVD